MVVPAFKSLLAPERRRRDTVPLVVGFQVKVVVLPAVAVMPEEGTLKGLSVDAPRTIRGDAKRATRVWVEKRILMLLLECG